MKEYEDKLEGIEIGCTLVGHMVEKPGGEILFKYVSEGGAIMASAYTYHKVDGLYYLHIATNGGSSTYQCSKHAHIAAFGVVTGQTTNPQTKC